MFNDIEDKTLQARNRGVVMANLVEDNLTATKKISTLGTKLLLTYFSEVANEDKALAYSHFEDQMKMRGFV